MLASAKGCHFHSLTNGTATALISAKIPSNTAPSFIFPPIRQNNPAVSKCTHVLAIRARRCRLALLAAKSVKRPMFISCRLRCLHVSLGVCIDMFRFISLTPGCCEVEIPYCNGCQPQVRTEDCRSLRRVGLARLWVAGGHRGRKGCSCALKVEDCGWDGDLARHIVLATSGERVPKTQRYLIIRTAERRSQGCCHTGLGELGIYVMRRS